MSWYHRIVTFLNHSVPLFRATQRTNPALLTGGHSRPSHPGRLGAGAGVAGPVALFPPPAQEAPVSLPVQHVKGGGKVGHVGGSIVGLRLSTFSEKVIANWPA